MNLRGFLVCISIFIGSLTASPRHAWAVDEATEQARKHYQEAQKQFDLGMWDEAIREFTKAYELRPDPTFLYNMAQAYRRSGNARRAIDLYKNYLIKVPRSPQRAEVEERIQNLQRQVDDEEREAKRAAPAPPTPPTPPTPSLIPEPAQGPGESTSPLLEAAPAAVRKGAVPSNADLQVTTGEGMPNGPVPAGSTTPVIAQAGMPPAPASATENAASPTEVAVKSQPPQDTGSRPLRIAGIAAGAAGLAGIAAGIVFSARTKSLSDSTSQAKQFNASDARAGKQAANLQWVCYGAGGAAVVAGALLYWRGRAHGGDGSGVGFVPMLSPAYAGLSATGAF